MILNSTLEILEISEKRLLLFLYKILGKAMTFTTPLQDGQAKHPSFLLSLFCSFLLPPSPLLSSTNAPCERCKESILQQARPRNRLFEDPGGSLWSLWP